MANINFSKLFLLIIIFFLLFGDVSLLKKNIEKLFKQYENNSNNKKYRKKGS
jgi:hypothetical protein